jgi:MFS transporter, DHA2 family, multidrug resistance protein
MTTSEIPGQSPPQKSVQPQSTTNPYVGILAVFLGAGLATLTSRLLSVGLPDLRGALGISFDDASWLPTAFNMATMFSGVFVVFLNAFGGPRRILLPAAAIFTVASFLLPFAPNYQVMMALVIVAGLASRPASAGAGVHTGNVGWIRPHRVGSDCLSPPNAVSKARQDHLQRP